MKFCPLLIFAQLALVATLLVAVPAQAQTRYYVDADATGNNNGSSWTHALGRLQNAISSAGPGDEIWVAAGTYYPDEGASVTNNDRSESFVLKPAVKIYGGFDGTDGAGGGAEETLLSERDVAAHTTILSGDIDKDGTSSGNAYHVVRGGSADANAMLDGFTITGGNANGSGADQSGGGLFIKNSSPTLSGLSITGNEAQNDGAGLFFDNSSSVLIQSTITGNTASRNGGGMYLLNSSPSIASTTFTNNTATGDGGGLYVDDGSTPGVTGLTFTDNTASGFGGGIFNQHSSLHVRSTILWGNSHSGGAVFAAQLFNDSAVPTVSYSIVQGSVGSGTGWKSGLGTDGGGNLAANPQLGALADNGGPTQTRLPAGLSPVIDAGSCYGQTVDQRGEAKPYDAADSSFPNTSDGCDIGAVELQSSEVSTRMIFVDADAMGADDGSSWADAYTTLQSALAVAVSGQQIWVAAGTYFPDEGTGQVPDARGSTFHLKDGVALYGGFDGTDGAGGGALETLLSQRDAAANVTILTGNIDKNNNNAGNAYHVVTANGVTTTAILDGFRIRGGNANGVTTARRQGGGIYIDGSPTLTNNTITHNIADWQGGGIYFEGYNEPTLMNNTIKDNIAEQGGGLYIQPNVNVTLTNNTIKGNIADLGGGIVTFAATTMLHNTITGNTANERGGGILIYTNPTLIDNTIAHNTATNQGGGLYIDRNTTGGPRLEGNTIAGNHVPGSGRGGGIYNRNSNTRIIGTILWGNTRGSDSGHVMQLFNADGATPTVSYSIVKGSGGSGASWPATLGTDGGGNLDADPMLGPLQDNGGPTLTMLPTSPDSPVVDVIPVDGSGKTSALGCGTSWTTDQRGMPRPADGNEDGTMACDIGAAEGQSRGALPVELTAFTATLDGTRVLLAWQTASETNNAGFEIEQGLLLGEADAPEAWQTLSFVEGHGTTVEPQTYSLLTGEIEVGRYAFRLRQIDYDGTFAYSPTVEVRLEVRGTHAMSAAYPNPFNPSTRMRLAVGRTQSVRVAVYDVLGRRVSVLFEGEMAAGRSEELVWEAGQVASGVYMIRAEGERFSEVRRVVLAK